MTVAGLARRVVERTALNPFPLTLELTDLPEVFTTSDRHQHMVIRTGAFDLVEASAEARRTFINFFDDMLAGIDVRIQLHVGSRASSGAGCDDHRLAGFLRERAATHPSFRREVHIVLSDSGRQIDRIAARWQAMRGRPQAASPEEATAEALFRHAEGVLSQLRSMGLHPRVLAGVELERFLASHVPRPIWQPAADCAWAERPDVVELEGIQHRTYFLAGYPGSDLLPGWLGPLLDLPAEYALSVHAFKVTPASALRMLNTRIRDLQATRLSDLASGAIGDPLMEAGLPEAIGLRREIAANQQHAFSVAVYLGIAAETRAELDELSHRAEDAAARSMAGLLPVTFQMAAGRVATAPIGVDPVGADHLLPSGVLGTLCPWVWDELQQPSGRLFGFAIRGNAPVLVDTFDEDRFANANIGLFGHSGAGKTYLMKSLLLADAERGMGAFIVDPEDEYREVCDHAGGQWIDMSLGSHNSINVLDPALSVVGERDPLGDQVSDLLDLIGTMCGTLTEEDRTDVDEALHEVLGGAHGTLADVRHWLTIRSRAPRVARALRRWTEGPIGELFSRPTSVRVDADFVVFGLRDLKEELLPVAYFLMAQWVWARVRSAPKPRRILFDEVGLLFEYPLVRRFLVRLARRVRKYQGSLCLVTQNAGDLLSSDQGLVLATNPSTLVLGAQRPAEAVRLQRAFGLTDGQTEFLASARRGSFLLIAGDVRQRIRVAAPPWFDLLLRPAAVPNSADQPGPGEQRGRANGDPDQEQP